jgi:hypothetical protein
LVLPLGRGGNDYEGYGIRNSREQWLMLCDGRMEFMATMGSMLSPGFNAGGNVVMQVQQK